MLILNFRGPMMDRTNREVLVWCSAPTSNESLSLGSTHGLHRLCWPRGDYTDHPSELLLSLFSSCQDLCYMFYVSQPSASGDVLRLQLLTTTVSLAIVPGYTAAMVSVFSRFEGSSCRHDKHAETSEIQGYYSFSIAARNAAGEGPASQVQRFLSASMPSPVGQPGTPNKRTCLFDSEGSGRWETEARAADLLLHRWFH